MAGEGALRTGLVRCIEVREAVSVDRVLARVVREIAVAVAIHVRGLSAREREREHEHEHRHD